MHGSSHQVPQQALCRQVTRLLDLVITLCVEIKVREWILIETEDVVQTKDRSFEPQTGN